nr:hypothetical protein asmbl_4 [uncultured bacterium]
MDEAPSEIAFEVPNLPPLKNEAKSMLATGHIHAERVRVLLAAAGEAVRRTGWTPTIADISVELVIRGPGSPPGDGTNYLGGIGDVLQAKTNTYNLDLTYLGELRDVALFVNDRQISRITYRREPAEQWSYSVRVSLVHQPSSATT